MSTSEDRRKVVPAQLNFLAIYSPVLGIREDKQRDQIVYYYSRPTRDQQRKKSNDGPSGDEIKQIENEQLRQVGLAQGMLNFAR